MGWVHKEISIKVHAKINHRDDLLRTSSTGVRSYFTSRGAWYFYLQMRVILIDSTRIKVRLIISIRPEGNRGFSIYDINCYETKRYWRRHSSSSRLIHYWLSLLNQSHIILPPCYVKKHMLRLHIYVMITKYNAVPPAMQSSHTWTYSRHTHGQKNIRNKGFLYTWLWNHHGVSDIASMFEFVSVIIRNLPTAGIEPW